MHGDNHENSYYIGKITSERPLYHIYLLKEKKDDD